MCMGVPIERGRLEKRNRQLKECGTRMIGVDVLPPPDAKLVTGCISDSHRYMTF